MTESKVEVKDEFGRQERCQEQNGRDEDEAPQRGAVRTGRAVIHLNCPLRRLLIRHWMGCSVVMVC